MWEDYFDMNAISEIRLKTTVYFGNGAIKKIDGIIENLKARGVNQVLCMTGGRSYKLTGAWDNVEAACKKHNVGITLYNKVTPNPTTIAIDEAVALAKKDGAKAVIGIGGGSPIDAGKSAAVGKGTLYPGSAGAYKQRAPIISVAAYGKRGALVLQGKRRVSFQRKRTCRKQTVRHRNLRSPCKRKGIHRDGARRQHKGSCFRQRKAIGSKAAPCKGKGGVIGHGHKAIQRTCARCIRFRDDRVHDKAAGDGNIAGLGHRKRLPVCGSRP